MCCKFDLDRGKSSLCGAAGSGQGSRAHSAGREAREQRRQYYTITTLLSAAASVGSRGGWFSWLALPQHYLKQKPVRYILDAQGGEPPASSSSCREVGASGRGWSHLCGGWGGGGRRGERRGGGGSGERRRKSASAGRRHRGPWLLLSQLLLGEHASMWHAFLCAW